MLGNTNNWKFPGPDHITQNKNRLPLRELWETWWARPKELRDADGLELLRVLAGLWGYRKEYRFAEIDWWQDAIQSLFVDASQLRYSTIIQRICQWLLLYPLAGAVDFLLDAIATTFTSVPEAKLTRVPDSGEYEWRDSSTLLCWLSLARYHRSIVSSRLG